MTFLVTSKDLEKDEDFLEDDNLKEAGSFNLIEEKADSKIGKENALLIKGNIYSAEGLKTVEDIDEIDEEFLKTVDGSFTALDIHQDELRIYRDPFGSRPVYFLEKEDEIFISDRIEPLLNFTEPRPEREVCLDYLHSGLADHGRKTFFQRIKQLRPGEILSYTQGDLEIGRAEYIGSADGSGIESLLESELENRLPEKDFVCPVSGGLDSTVLASMVKDRDAEFVHSSFDIDTGDEEYFGILDREFGLDAERIEFKISELVDEIAESIEVFEQPTSMIAIQAQNMMFRRVRDSLGESVILDGTGADELFYGYPRFTPYYIAEQLRENPIKGLKDLKNYRHHLSAYSYREILRVLTSGLYSNSHSMPELDHQPDLDRPLTLVEAGESNLEEYNFPHILHVLEKSRGEYGHELRLPFLSAQLKRRLDETDPGENFDSGLTKYLLRDAFTEDIPEEVFKRKKKTGFVELEASQINNTVDEKFREVFQSESFRDREMFNGDLFYRRFEEGMQGFFKCYRFYCFECWMRSFID